MRQGAGTVAQAGRRPAQAAGQRRAGTTLAGRPTGFPPLPRPPCRRRSRGRRGPGPRQWWAPAAACPAPRRPPPPAPQTGRCALGCSIGPRGPRPSPRSRCWAGTRKTWGHSRAGCPQLRGQKRRGGGAACRARGRQGVTRPPGCAAACTRGTAAARPTCRGGGCQPCPHSPPRLARPAGRAARPPPLRWFPPPPQRCCTAPSTSGGGSRRPSSSPAGSRWGHRSHVGG